MCVIDLPDDAPPAAVSNEMNLMNEFEAEPLDGGGMVMGDPIVNGFDDFGGVGETPQVPVEPIHQIVPSEEPESLVTWRTDKAALLQQQVCMFVFVFM